MTFHRIPSARWVFYRVGEEPLDIMKLMVTSCSFVVLLEYRIVKVSNGYLSSIETKSFCTN